MLTERQKAYLAILSPKKAEKIISIEPFNPAIPAITERVMQEIRTHLPQADVRCMGSSVLGISGENDIDMYVLIDQADLQYYITSLNELFAGKSGPDKSQTHLHKWYWEESGSEVTVFLSDKNDKWVKEQLKTFDLLVTHPEIVKKYEEMKGTMNGKTLKEYKIAKYEFYNKMLGINDHTDPQYNYFMTPLLKFFKKNSIAILGLVAVMALTGFIEYLSHRSLLGPDGMFGWWAGNIWGSENSQRVADAYSFSHLIHGMLFYAFLWLVARRVPAKYRFIMAVIMEASWELLENSPFIIDRYRAATIAQGYVGDSILNSVSDILMASIGFVVARYSKVWVTVALIIAMEVGCLIWIRDNLTLNIVMLVHPIEAIKMWQSGDILKP